MEHTLAPDNIALNPDGNKIVVKLTVGTINILDFNTLTSINSIDIGGFLIHVNFNPIGNNLAISRSEYIKENKNYNNDAYLLNSESLDIISKIEGENENIVSLK